MDEMVQDKQAGFMSRIAGIFTRTDELEDEQQEVTPEKQANGGLQLRANYRYTVTVRRQITSFDDAMAAANGLKRGEQQILNLTATDPITRQKIVDFMCGVNYAQLSTLRSCAGARTELAPPISRRCARAFGLGPSDIVTSQQDRRGITHALGVERQKRGASSYERKR